MITFKLIFLSLDTLAKMEQEGNDGPDERNGEEFEIIDIMEFLGNRELEDDDNHSSENSEEGRN